MRDMVLCLSISFLIFIIKLAFCIDLLSSSSPDVFYPGAEQKVLFLTNSDHEQSKAFLAICQLLIQYPFVDVHIASFLELGDKVSNLPTGLSRVRFHPLKGTPYAKRLEFEGDHLSGLSHPPGFRGTTASRSDLPAFQVPWNGPEYLETYRSMLDVINTVDPALVVIDPLLRQANDAVLQLGYQYVILSTSNLRDMLVIHQSAGKMIREYPAWVPHAYAPKLWTNTAHSIGSGFASPLPWYFAPYNAYLWLQRALTIVFSLHLHRLRSCRQHYGVRNPVDLVDWFRHDVTVIITSSLEIEYPISVPPNVIACGPILPPALLSTNRDQYWQGCLKCWHELREPILLIDLQSLTEADAREIAHSLIAILLEYENLHVVWNIKNQTETPQSADVHSMIDTISDLSKNRIRKLQLNTADIASLLAGETISCIVHRGEAGLFHDALMWVRRGLNPYYWTY